MVKKKSSYIVVVLPTAAAWMTPKQDSHAWLDLLIIPNETCFNILLKLKVSICCSDLLISIVHMDCFHNYIDYRIWATEPVVFVM